MLHSSDNETAPRKEIAILVVSWDGCQDVWKPFFHCFSKYWPDCPFPIFLGSNFLQHRTKLVTPILVGQDKDYSSNLIAMLSMIEHEWILLMVEDALLSGTVDTQRIQEIITVAQSQAASHVQLVARNYSLHNIVITCDSSAVISEIPRGVPYRVSIGLGLWRKSVLLQLLRPGETAWEIERRGTVRSFDLDAKFFCVSNNQIPDPPFKIVHGVLKGKWTWAASEFLHREGLIDDIKGRPTESYFFHHYFRSYVFLRYLVFKMIYTLYGKTGISRLAAKKG